MCEETSEPSTLLFPVMVGFIIAVIWPFVYPGLDYLMSIVEFWRSPGIFKALTTFGPMYGELWSDAPGFFKGMAEASHEIHGEDPQFASLPYMVKTMILIYVSAPIYVAEVVVFVIVVIITLLSRASPCGSLTKVLQVIAIVIAAVPFFGLFLAGAGFIVFEYVQAWSAGFLNFLFLLLVWPLVLAKVWIPMGGVTVFATFFVPSGLLLGGKDSLAVEAYEGMFGG
jgi:hypothetical protein